MAENLDVERSSGSNTFSLKVDDVTGTKSFEHRERYLHLLSRFCLAFVNVGSKVFLLKEAAI